MAVSFAYCFAIAAVSDLVMTLVSIHLVSYLSGESSPYPSFLAARNRGRIGIKESVTSSSENMTRKLIVAYLESGPVSWIFFATVRYLDAIADPEDVWVSNWLMVYRHVDDFGWVWLILSPIVFIVIYETGSYWMHRAMHYGPLYIYIHSVHHQYRAPTTATFRLFDGIDMVVQQIFFLLPAFIIPLHIHMLSIITVVLLTLAAWVHCGGPKMSGIPWLDKIRDHHHGHHMFCRRNYSTFFLFWDHWMGTYVPSSK